MHAELYTVLDGFTAFLGLRRPRKEEPDRCDVTPMTLKKHMKPDDTQSRGRISFFGDSQDIGFCRSPLVRSADSVPSRVDFLPTVLYVHSPRPPPC